MINEAKDKLASICSVGSSTSCFSFESPWPVSFMTPSEHCITMHAVTKSSPSPSISCTENAHLDVHISRIKVSDPEPGHSVSASEAEVSKKLQDIHISAQLMENFLELARDNTKKDLETCGILGAFLKMGTFYVTTLIVPKQESTSNTCQAINEEEIFAIQHEKSLLPLGWIHTHPSQSCFMSSVDLHTQYSYQAMVPEAFSIVMAPTDTSRFGEVKHSPIPQASKPHLGKLSREHNPFYFLGWPPQVLWHIPVVGPGRNENPERLPGGGISSSPGRERESHLRAMH